MDSVSAWLLTASPDCLLAIGRHEMLEVLSRPRVISIPATPAYCRQLIIWRGQMLPLMRPSELLDPQDSVDDQPVFVAVVAYQENPGDPLKYGALALSEVPRVIKVEPGPAGEPDRLNQAIRDNFLLSCFEYQGQSVLILDLRTLFSSPPQPFTPPNAQLSA